MEHEQALKQTNTVRVREAFDNVAGIFETQFENEITQRLRELTYGAIRSIIPSHASILDINCGTGIDAIALAREGFKVVGMDISPGMIEYARQTAAGQQIRNVEFYVSSFEDLSVTEDRKYDLVFSNFGGLNCVEKFDSIAMEIANVTQPGSYFVGVVMPPICLWEIVAGMARFDFKNAFRRLRCNTQATGFQGKTFTVFYHSPRTLTAAFRKWFTVERIYGLSIISPPPHATGFKQTFSRLSKFLEDLDMRIAFLPLFRSVGDHFVLVAKRHR